MNFNRKTHRYWLQLALIYLLPLDAAAATRSNDTELKVAVLAFRGAERAMDRWSTTMQYLTDNIPGYRFTALPMNLSELDQAVVHGTIDFVITNSGQYVRVGSKYGMSWLATLKSRRDDGHERVIGSALVVRADSPYHILEDLQGSTLGAVGPLAFGGFQIYWGEMVQRGYRPRKFFGHIKFSSFPVDALVFWVRDGLVDAAVLPACLLETMHAEGLIEISQYRVIDPKQIDSSCQTSTPLYPNWSFSALKSTPPQLVEKVTQALLRLAPDSAAARNAGSLGWTAPVSSYDIHQLYKRLYIHPWQEPWWLEARAWFLRNWQWGLAMLLLSILGFLHHLWVQLQVSKRTHELQQINEELLYQQQQLEHAQRVAILGELSSDLAHELNQPLTAINSYAEGGTVRIEKASDGKDLIGLLARISSEAQRGARIIERIRGFAKKQKVKRERVDLSLLIRETLNLLEYELKRHRIKPELNLPDNGVLVSVDPVEIQQLLVNLVRNSLDALDGIGRTPQLIISAQVTEAGQVTLEVEDNGHGINENEIETLFKPFYSTKPDGLGLGMAVCRRIIDAHRGKIEMKSSASGGTTVSCVFNGADYG